MNTINASTGFSLFMLKSAHSPHLILPLTNVEHAAQEQPDMSNTPEIPWHEETPNPENGPTAKHNNTTPCDTILDDTAYTILDTTSTPPNKMHPSNNTTSTEENSPPASDGKIKVQCVFNQLAGDLIDAQDSLTVAKISQACHANKNQSPDPEFKAGDCVFLATAHRC